MDGGAKDAYDHSCQYYQENPEKCGSSYVRVRQLPIWLHES